VITLIGILFQKYALFFILFPILSSTIYTVIYSYVEYQKVMEE